MRFHGVSVLVVIGTLSLVVVGCGSTPANTTPTQKTMPTAESKQATSLSYILPKVGMLGYRISDDMNTSVSSSQGVQEATIDIRFTADATETISRDSVTFSYADAKVAFLGQTVNLSSLDTKILSCQATAYAVSNCQISKVSQSGLPPQLAAAVPAYELDLLKMVSIHVPQHPVVPGYSWVTKTSNTSVQNQATGPIAVSLGGKNTYEGVRHGDLLIATVGTGKVNYNSVNANMTEHQTVQISTTSHALQALSDQEGMRFEETVLGTPQNVAITHTFTASTN